MKTKIIFENENENYTENVNTDLLEKTIENALLISLLKNGFINQDQYERYIEKQ